MAYEIPHVQTLLTISSFLFLATVAETLCTFVFRAGLIGPLVIGIIFGPQASNILSDSDQKTFTTLGYLGLVLLVFEAGLSTNVSLLMANVFLSLAVALTGILFPVAISIVLLHFGYGYSVLQSFAAGAALCSTSLGTTLALFKPELRQTRTGAILMGAALLDDIAGLVMAAVVAKVSVNNWPSGFVPWRIIVRPILVSIGFAVGTPLSAYAVRLSISKICSLRVKWRYRLYSGTIQLFILVIALSGFVAAAQFAGTSGLFGAYLAGVFLTLVFGSLQPDDEHDNMTSHKVYLPQTAFIKYLFPLHHVLLSPIFFASIGIALPIRSLGSANGSRRVIWRGLVYSTLMALGKVVVGVWMLIWPTAEYQRGWCGVSRKSNNNNEQKGRKRMKPENGAPSIHSHEVTSLPSDTAVHQFALDSNQPKPSLLYPINYIHSEPQSPTISRTRSALLLGVAMIARGEIALIVAQLARPLLIGSSASENSEPFAIVIWAILVTTLGGAIAVGRLLKS